MTDATTTTTTTTAGAEAEDGLDRLREDTAAGLAAAADLRALDAVRVGALGRNGRLTALLKGLGAVPPEARRDRRAALNRLKAELEAAIETRRAALEATAL